MLILYLEISLIWQQFWGGWNVLPIKKGRGGVYCAPGDYYWAIQSGIHYDINVL